jgi:uncharacterized membrane protein
MVLGIIAFILSLIPCIGGWIAFLPALIGLILSILGLLQSKKTGQGRGMAIAGIVLCILVLAWIPISLTLLAGMLGGMGAAATHIPKGL